MCIDISEKENTQDTISIICVFNNKEAFENQLKGSLKKQDIDYELIALDNSDNRFKSAAEALNYGSRKANGEILVYSHQDIFLKSSKELRVFSEAIKKCPSGTVIGTQGVKEPSKVYFSNITSGSDYDDSFISDYKNDFYEVSCVDEGFFGMKKSTWEKLKFNEVLCDNWHLYCVEMCLHTRLNGNQVCVWPTQLHHYSTGKISLGYMKNLKLLCKKYHRHFKFIWTTCYKVRTNWLYINILYYAWIINRMAKGRLK